MHWKKDGPCWAFRRMTQVALVASLTLAPGFSQQNAIASGSESAGQHDEAEHGDRAGVYYVTLSNETYAQGFSFPVAATHVPTFHLFQVGQYATVQAANIAQIGTPVPMYNLLHGQQGADVTDLYVHPFPIASGGAGTSFWKTGLPYFDGDALVPNLYSTVTDHTLTSSMSFTITAEPGDRFSLLMMMMCTNDGLAGLDAVRLPQGVGHVATYAVYAYDAGVELNTERSADIVDPCGLMAPLQNGQPQVSTTDGNRNAPPSPSQAPPSAASDPSIQTHDPIARYRNPTVAGHGDIPANFAWKASKLVGKVTITKIKTKTD